MRKTNGRDGAVLRGLMRRATALNDHWIGDAIGAASLFFGGWLVPLFGYAIGLQ